MAKFFRLAFVAVSLATVAACAEDYRAPERLLYVWLHDKTMVQPNFLAVLDADSNSSNYGQIITTVPVGERGGMAHHTQIYLPKSGMIFANDFTGNNKYIYSIHQIQTNRGWPSNSVALMRSLLLTVTQSYPMATCLRPFRPREFQMR